MKNGKLKRERRFARERTHAYSVCASRSIQQTCVWLKVGVLKIGKSLCTSNRLRVLVCGQNKQSKRSIKKTIFAMQRFLVGNKQKLNGPFSGGVLKSEIQPERSTHSPTEVKETLN